MVISIAGGVEKEILAEKLMMYFDGVKEGELPEYKKFVNDQKESRVAVHYKQTDQAYLGLGVHTFGRTSPDRYALNLLHNILGETMSSRLWNEIREKRGLAYFVGTDIERYSDCGSLLAIAGVKISSIEEVIKLICEQFVLIKEKGVTNEELVRAKQMWKGKMILGFEDSYNVAAWYGTQELLDDEVKLPDDVLSKTDLVTSEDILRVSQNIFKDSFLNLAVLGPFKDEVKFSELLKI
jgi:predicted Zn-dependent peptidase